MKIQRLAMEIQEKLLKFKFHIILALISSLVLITLIINISPSFLTILAYFWPLFLSTALFLVAVIFFGKTSVPASSSSSSAEGLLDYVVAGPHHPAVELVQPSHHDEAPVEDTFKSE